MRAQTASVFLVLSMCLPALPAPADKDLTQLSIVVMDQKDRPVPKASITVTFVSGHKMFVKKVRSEWNSKTNSKGVAELPGMPAGKVRLQVIAQGFQTLGKSSRSAGRNSPTR